MRLARPVAPEAFPVPTHDGCRLNQDKRLSPAVPEPPETDPDKPIRRPEAWASARRGENANLVPEGEVLEDKTATGLEDSKQGCRKSADEFRHYLESRQERPKRQ